MVLYIIAKLFLACKLGVVCIYLRIRALDGTIAFISIYRPMIRGDGNDGSVY